MKRKITQTDRAAGMERLQEEALRILREQLAGYRNELFLDPLICRIEEKKTEMIRRAKTKGELKAILFPKAPTYNGTRWVCDKYLLPEEELFAWSRTSLNAPLNALGMERYLQLFQELLPEEWEKFKNTEGTQ